MALDVFKRTLGDLQFTATVATNAITVTTVVAGGSGYLVGDTIDPTEITSEAVIDTGVLPTDFLLTVATIGALGAIATFTITTPGTDGTDGDLTANRVGGTEDGVSNTSDYFDHANYEGGGVVEEYKTGANLVVTVAETVGVIDTLVPKAGYEGTNYRVGDVVAISGGVGGLGIVATITDPAVGDVATITVSVAGTGYVDGDENTVFVSRKLKTTATGEYVGANSDNDPTVKVVRVADAQQLQVQKRTIDGGTITVFAEPTTVNAYGEVVGNTIRAEDICDEYRCVAVYLSDGVTSRYTWDVTTEEEGNRADYGFCREKTPVELAGDALVDADCPAGHVHSATNCVTVVYTTVNTDEGADTITPKVAREQCVAGGNWYEPSEAKGSRCIEAVADNFSLANFAYTTNSSAQDYAATVCQQMQYDWKPVLRTCVAAADVTTLVTQATCLAAGHVWVAGTCYNKADFGDGYSRQGNEGNTTVKIPK